jgi:NAD(P)-dependent dehydrogenase (short-subunit alcohol dehydrogenase family)
MSFKNKTVVVAGGTSGISLAAALSFAEEGAKVAVLSRSEDKVNAAVELLREKGGDALGFSADVRDIDALHGVMKSVAEAWGGIDVLVSGAAGNFAAPASELSGNAFKTVVDIDLLGCFNVMRAAYPYFNKPGAAVLNIGAPQSWLPTPMQIHVCAAKAGIDQVTRTAAIEWGKEGIRVNAIAPGPIADTEGMRRLAPTPAAEAVWTRSVPLGRYGTKDELSGVIRWLCSEQAAYITGAIIPVDGGWSLGGSSNMTLALNAK